MKKISNNQFLIALQRKVMPKLPASLPQLMRAVVLPSPSLSPETLQLRNIPVKLPQGREILVKVAACAVAYRDILDRKGAFPFIKKPTVLGHEFSGVVASVGPDAKEFQIGQRVVSLHWAQRDAWPSPLQVICFGVAMWLLNCDRQGSAAVPSMLGLMCDGGYAEYERGFMRQRTIVTMQAGIAR